MALATMTTVNAILKEVYEGRLTDQLNTETIAIKRIEKTSDGVTNNVGGKYVTFPIHVSRNGGIGYRLENEAIPNPYTQGYAAVTIPLRFGYGSVRYTGQVMRLAESNPQAFADASEREMDGLKTDLRKDTNRIAYGDGTGLLATVTADGANTVTVDNTQYIEIGTVIDVRTKSTGALIGTAERTITAVTITTYPAGTVTYSGADLTATATTDGIYRSLNWVGAVQREPTGFAAIASSTSTLFGLTVAAQPKWAGSMFANGGTNRALSEGLMIQACDQARINGGKPTVIFYGLGVRRSYFNLLTQQRRYTDTKEFTGGFQGLPFNYGTEIPCVEDVDCPPNRMFGISEGDIKIYQEGDWHWMNEDGSILQRVIDANGRYDAFEAVMRKYWEMGCQRRNSHFIISDLIEG